MFVAESNEIVQDGLKYRILFAVLIIILYFNIGKHGEILAMVEPIPIPIRKSLQAWLIFTTEILD